VKKHMIVPTTALERQMDRLCLRQAAEKVATDELIEAALRGFASAVRGEFPPANPYAPCGVDPDEPEDTPASSWFRGYWRAAREFPTKGRS